MIPFLLACAHLPPAPAVAAPSAPVVVVAAPRAPSIPGSLYSEVGSTKLTGADANARRVGDLITVLIEESAKTQMDANTNVSHKTGNKLTVGGLFGLKASITKANPNLGAEFGVDGGHETGADGSGTTAQNGSLAATLTCQVQEVLANGNLRIRGTKELRVNRETQFLTLEGVIRPRDIQLNNTIQSNLIAEARVEFAGQGVISNQQRQAWGGAIINAVSPL